MGAESFDAIVIGTGQSGPTLATDLAARGQRVAIVERGRFGGTCVNTGCIPTKSLVASARVAWLARRAQDFGVDAGPVRVDMRAVHERMRAISARSSQGVERWLTSTDGVTVVRGHARFGARDTVQVGERTLRAPKIFVNVGARAIVPPSFTDAGPLTNSGMLALAELPAHLLVVGGSYIGLEFAQMFARFGSKVTVFERGDRLIAREDEDVSASVRALLEAEGVTVRTSSECLAAERRGARVAVRAACAPAPEWVEGSHVLVAVGRRPNTDDLGADRAGLELDDRGHLRVDDRLRTNVPGIWAIGDCNGRGGFTHTSYNDYEIVYDQLFGDDRRRVTDRIPCYALFVDPPLGRVGITEQQARAAGRPVLIGTRPMANVGRAYERSETHGFMKVLVDAETERILGASIHGIEGDEVVHTLLAAMYCKASYRVLAEAVHIHPTVAELLPTLLQTLAPLEPVPTPA
jgi:pyruvate/2-oxoglutarate dehydrogenase complex dihydrolipoamide dehydrogenase (E3) component